jgi:hypothetical protein
LRPPEEETSTEDLQEKQKAYESFHAKLVAYNKRYTPAHVPEMLLNTPSRLAKWCRAMLDLYLRVEHEPPGPLSGSPFGESLPAGRPSERPHEHGSYQPVNTAGDY